MYKNEVMKEMQHLAECGWYVDSMDVQQDPDFPDLAMASIGMKNDDIPGARYLFTGCNNSFTTRMTLFVDNERVGTSHIG